MDDKTDLQKALEALQSVGSQESNAVQPAKVKDALDEYLQKQAAEIAELKNGLKMIANHLMANQKPSQSFIELPSPASYHPVIPIIQETVSQPVISSTFAIPKVQDTPTIPAGALVAPDVFYRFAINQLKNKPSKDGKKYDGVHAVYSGLNVEVRKYYGKDTDVVALTAMLEKQGKIVTRMVKGGPIVFLPEDFKNGAGSSTLNLDLLK